MNATSVEHGPTTLHWSLHLPFGCPKIATTNRWTDPAARVLLSTTPLAGRLIHVGGNNHIERWLAIEPSEDFILVAHGCYLASQRRKPESGSYNGKANAIPKTDGMCTYKS